MSRVMPTTTRASSGVWVVNANGAYVRATPSGWEVWSGGLPDRLVETYELRREAVARARRQEGQPVDAAIELEAWAAYWRALANGALMASSRQKHERQAARLLCRARELRQETTGDGRIYN